MTPIRNMATVGRIAGRIACVLAVALAAVIIQTAPASASTLTTTCAGSATTTWEPGLTNDPRMVTGTTDYDYSPCVTLPNPLAGPTSGTDGVTVQVQGSCTNLTSVLNDIQVSGTVHWNTGATSSYSGTSRSENVNGTMQIITEGTVTSGLFAGNTFARTITFVNLDLTGCSEPEGVTETNGLIVLEILPI